MSNKTKKPAQIFIPAIVILLFALSFILIRPGFTFAEPVPSKPAVNLYVFDYANIIDEIDETKMQKIAKAIDDKTTAQVVVVTVNDLNNMEIEDYALQLFRSWGIGDKEKNNGVLILVNRESIVNNQRGRIRIEVGYGLEGAINDAKAGAILDNYAIPAFESENYSKGIYDTFMAVCSEVAKEYGLDLSDEEFSQLSGYSTSTESDGIPFINILIIFIILVVILTFLPPSSRRGRSSRTYRGGGFGGGGFGGGGFGGGGFGGGKSGGGGASR